MRPPEAYGFRQVGYFAAVPERQVDDLEAIAAQQAEVGYDSELVLGNGPCADVLTWLWPDFEARGVAAVLHERRGGWADAAATVRELAAGRGEAGVRDPRGRPRHGLDRSGGEVAAVLTDRGAVRCDLAVVVPGPWAHEWLARFGADPGAVATQTCVVMNQSLPRTDYLVDIESVCSQAGSRWSS